MSPGRRSALQAVLGVAAPPTDDDVLIPGEWYVYRERQHPLVLVPALLRALGAVWLALLIVLGLPFGSMTLIEFVLLAVGAVAMYDWYRQRTPTDVAVRLVLLVALSVSLGFRARGTAVVLAAAVVAGFFYRVVQWRYYQLLYVTNRRMIQTGGVFERTYNMMPVTKITDLRQEVSWLGEALDYGTINVESAGQVQALQKLEYLLEPDRFVRDVLRLATRPATMDDD